MKLYISNIMNGDKPSSEQIKLISSSILSNPVNVTLQEFAEEVAVNGKTTVLAELKSKKLSKYTNIVGQELVMLDFDNKDPNNLYTIDDLEQDTFMQENACFIYRTFSDSNSNVDKFRVVFHLDRLITINSEIEDIYRRLFELYPQADTSVGQTSRLFFGSNSGYEVIDWDNVLNVEKLFNRNFLTVKDSDDIIDINTPSYLLLKYKKYDLLKEKWGEQYSQEFSDYIVANQYFKSLDMKEFLELPDGNPFLDILHLEDNPSASVFYEKDLNIYLYKCFSETNSFNGDILSLLRKYLKLDRLSEATDILIKCTDSEVNHSSKLGLMKRDAKEFKHKLVYKELEKSHPELYSYYKRYESEIIAVLDVMFDFTYMDKRTGEIKYINYISIDKLSNIVSRLTNKKVSKVKMWNIINLIVVTELISKVDMLDIPKDLLDNLINKQKNDSEQIRTSNVYEPLIDIEKSYEIAKVMKDNKVTVSGLSYELVYRLFGEEKAFKDFPQAYNPLKERGLIKMSNDDPNLTKKQSKFEKIVVKSLFDEINTKGYCFEKDLIRIVGKKSKLKQATVRTQLNKLKPELLNKYSLSCYRISKEQHKKLDIKEEFVSKNIFILNN